MGFRVVSALPPPSSTPGEETDSISIEDVSYSVVEGSSVVVRARRSTNKASPVAVSADWAITGLTEGAPAVVSGTLSWAAGETGLKTHAATVGLVTAARAGQFALSNPQASAGAAPTLGTSSVSFTIQNDTTPPATVTLEAVPASSSSISLSASGGSDSGSGFDEWEFEQSPNGTSGWAVIGTQVSGSLTASGLVAGTEYFFRATARDVAGNETTSAVVSATTLAEEGVEITWTAPTENPDGSALTDLAGFKIYYGLDPETPSDSLVVANPAATSAFVPGLTAGTWYFVVAAFDSEGHESVVSDQVQKVVS